MTSSTSTTPTTSTGFVTDANGELYEHMEYFPFGETWVQEHTNTLRTPYLFTGKELDQETGLYYYGARYYDPRTSVWQSADPIFGKYLDGKLNGGIFSSTNFALYNYGAMNPLRFNDPTGRFNSDTGEIEKGDTLDAIRNQLNAKFKTNLSTKEWAARNNIGNPNKIYAGDHINIDPYQPVPFIDDKGKPVLNIRGVQMMKPAGLDPHTMVDRGRAMRKTAGGVGVLASLYNFRQGGPWDTQRRGPGKRSIPALIDSATVNIGLYGAATGMDERALLGIENEYARRKSHFGNVPMDPTYTHLPHSNVWNTYLGYDLYNSGRIGESH